MRRTIGRGRRDGASAPSAYPERKPRPRLESFDYQGQHAYHVVLLTQARSPRFTDHSLARRCIGYLKRTAELLGFKLLAFCFMPDHLHILVLGRDDMAKLIRFVQRFKQLTSFEFKRDAGLRLWQQSFYDRTLRVEEDLADVASYVLDNPVRAGLVNDRTDHSLSGGEYAEADGAEAPSLLLRGTSRPSGGPHV